ncbi:MAG: hypothetical protein Q4P14_00370 [Methanobacteriaceae archaeon]|nr:hypothetical protein [Methanobacteriaceae archaeon]
MVFVNIGVNVIIFVIGISILGLLKSKLSKYQNVNTENWMPNEQTQELRQVFYLILAGLLFIDLYYLILINTSYSHDLVNFAIFDLILSIFAGIYVFDKDNLIKTIILLITLVPLTSYALFSLDGITMDIFIIIEIIHSIGIIFIIIETILRFREYSKSNRLGYTILILYMIVFICVFLTTKAENLNILDSLVYCSNAFTSNGYGLVNATNYFGKIISIVLVWSGYLLSGVGTALLTLALVNNYYKNKLKEQEDKINEINKKLDILLKKE